MTEVPLQHWYMGFMTVTQAFGVVVGLAAAAIFFRRLARLTARVAAIERQVAASADEIAVMVDICRNWARIGTDRLFRAEERQQKADSTVDEIKTVVEHLAPPAVNVIVTGPATAEKVGP